MRRFVPALLLAALVIASAPFVGLVRDALFDRFQAAAVRNLTIALLALAAALFLWAVVRIRERRLWRYAGLALAAALLVLQSALFSAGLGGGSFAAQVDVAEKIHLVEYGLLAYLLYRAFRPAGDARMLLLPLVWLTFAGVIEESVQWLVETRLGEVRDVFLNLYAGVCGLLFSLALDPPKRFAWGLAGGRQVANAVALLVLALGLFVNAAHLGYEHHDPQIGRFRSWHTLDELRRAAADRAERWRRDPPTELSPWRLEDLFLTEAAWHVHHRNERYEARDLYKAAQANRILERYYAPFLDLESFRGSGRHRYPEEIRRQLEAGAPRYDPADYLSPVLVQRITPWPPKALFFAVLIPAVVAIWLLPWLWERARRRGRRPPVP